MIPSVLQMLTHLIPQQPYEIGTVIIPNLQMRRVRSVRWNNLHRASQLPSGWANIPTWPPGCRAGFYLPYFAATYRRKSSIPSKHNILNHILEITSSDPTNTTCLHTMCQTHPSTKLTRPSQLQWKGIAVSWLQAHHTTQLIPLKSERWSKSHMASLEPKSFQDNWWRSGTTVQSVGPKICPGCKAIQLLRSALVTLL